MTIKKKGNKFQLISKTGKNLGTFPTEAAAQKREKQVNAFKNTKKSDGNPIDVITATAFKKSFLADVHERYDMNDAEQRETASCIYIAMDEIEREDTLQQIARAGDKTLEAIMADAKPRLDDGTPVDLLSGSATTGMLVIERLRSGETGNIDGDDMTGNTNEHDHSFDPAIAGFTSPDAADGHVHWVDTRMSSTGPGGTGFHIHSTNATPLARNDDLIIFGDEAAIARGDFGGLEIGGLDYGGTETEFDGIFTGIDRASAPYGGKKKKPETRRRAGEMDNPGVSGLPLTTRNRGSALNNLATRESRERADRAESKKKRRITGQERLFGKLDPDAQDVALLPPAKQNISF